MGMLQIGGVDVSALAEQYGTPLYVYDEGKIISQAESAVKAFSSSMFDTEVVYASKAFSSVNLYRLLGSLGVGFDVVSGGELYGAKKAGADLGKVYFHGNNKSDAEIEEALEAGAGYFVVDNVQESRRIAAKAEEMKKSVRALLRINPGISAHTHEYIMTASPDSKFGIYIENRDEIEEVLKVLGDSPRVDFRGFHSHIGSQIVDAGSFEKAIDAMTDFLADMKRDYGLDDMEFSIGGGFGIRYTDEHPASLAEMCADMIACAEKCIKEKGIGLSKLITEPGRAMVGEAGYSIYTIGDMKKSGDKSYIFVDGGMSDNIRPALYDAEYRADIAGKYGEEKTETYCIAGKNCESGDVLIKESSLPKAERGDLLVIYSTGAYGYSMASNYNRLGRPPVIFARDGESRVVIRRENYEDQYKLELE